LTGLLLREGKEGKLEGMRGDGREEKGGREEGRGGRTREGRERPFW